MKTVYIVTKPKSSKAIAVCKFASTAISTVSSLIMTGPYLQEDILDNTTRRLLERDLIEEDVKIKTCQGYFKITRMFLIH